MYIIIYLHASIFFKEPRKQYLPAYFLRHNNNTYNSANLIASTGLKILNRLSEFIAIVLNKFKQIHRGSNYRGSTVYVLRYLLESPQ